MSAPARPTALIKPLYTARATATGGRSGHAVTDDGLLDVHLKPPREMGGPGGATNPEQLFAAGYAACFQSALGVAGRRAGVDTEDSLVEADVSIGTIGGGGYGLAVALKVAIPGVDADTTAAAGRGRASGLPLLATRPAATSRSPSRPTDRPAPRRGRPGPQEAGLAAGILAQALSTRSQNAGSSTVIATSALRASAAPPKSVTVIPAVHRPAVSTSTRAG